MTRRMNNKSKVVKVLSIVLSAYMALSPMVVYADELADAENNLSVQIGVRDEAAKCVEEAVDNAVTPEAQVNFENMVANVDVSGIDSRNTLEDTSALVQDEINRIENDAIKEAADAIVNVDMSNVDDALNTVTELLDNTLTDEAVANEIEAAADALIDIYDTQAEVALNTLKVISGESEAVTLLEDGSVSVDWDKATEEVKALHEMYLKAESDKEKAELAKEEAIKKQQTADEKQKAASSKAEELTNKADELTNKADELTNKADELNNEIINDKKDIISESKLNKSNDINSLINTIAVDNNKSFKIGDTIDKKIEGSSDICRFFVNTVEDGITYGCLTYYDSESKTILRKNFSISASGEIDYNYVPKDEWVKGNENCKNALFGNGGNYVVAYVGNNINSYLTTDKVTKEKVFSGTVVSNIMRDNLVLNNAIDARNKAIDARNEAINAKNEVINARDEAINARDEAINELQAIEVTVAEVENELKAASETADNALNKYKEAVAMYKDVASLEDEINKSEVEIAMLEYVKAEVEVFRRQQILDQVKEARNNSNVSNTAEIYNAEEQENIETVINNIASNLGVEPEAVEDMVVQTIIETENNFYGAANDVKKVAVAGVRKDEAEVEEVNAKPVTENEVAEDAIEIQDETQDVVTINDNVVPLAGTVADAGYSVNWWLPLIIASICVAWMMFVVAKKNKKEEETTI